MTNIEREKKLLNDLVLDAAFLHREFMGQEASLQFTQADGQITYAVDNDVFRTFCAPWEFGPAEFSRAGDVKTSGYGQLLPRLSGLGPIENVDQENLRQDETIRAIMIARILTEDWLDLAAKKSAKETLWQFPGHFQETDQQIKWIDRVARRERVRGSTNGTDHVFRLASFVLRARLQGVTDPDIARRRIQEAAELVMYRELIGSNKRLLEQENYHTVPTKFSIRASLQDVTDLDESISIKQEKLSDYQAAFELLYGFWRKVLIEGRNASASSINRDADSLAKLAIINKQLLDAGQRHRVVLVTGSKRLVHLAYRAEENFRAYMRNRVISESLTGATKKDPVEEYRKWSLFFGFDTRSSTSEETLWFRNFSLNYVRHIWSIANQSLIEPAQSERVNDLFVGLFARIAKRDQLNRSDIEDIVVFPWHLTVSTLDEAPGKVFAETLTQWDKLTARSTQERRAKELKFPTSAAEIIRGKVEKVVSAQELSEMLQEQVNRQRDRSMLELSDMGARSFLQLKELSVRNPPDLQFSTLKNTNTILRNLYKDGIYSTKPSRFLEDYNKIALDCVPIEDTRDGDDRQLSYLRFLVLGAVFASAEKWHVALGHAERAIRTIVRYPQAAIEVREADDQSDQAKMTGREAWFLTANCKRMLATNRAEVMACLPALKNAEDAYKAGLNDGDRTRGQMGPERLLSERLAIALSAHYFDLSEIEAHGITGVGKVSNALEVFEASKNLVKQLRLSENPDDFCDGPMTLLTKISVATNLLQTAVLIAREPEPGCLNFSGDDRIVDAHLTMRCVIFLSAMSKRRASIETFLVKAYRTAGAILIGRPALGFCQDATQLLQFFDDGKASYSMKYDAWRYDMLSRFLGDRLASLNARPH
jgi:hypothetical protein